MLMRYLRFISPQTAPEGSWGQLGTDDAIELLSASPLLGSQPTGRTCSLSDISSYLPPADPPNIFGVGLNYRTHSEETNNKLPTEPVIFIKATSSLAANGDVIRLPIEAPNEVDYEGELAVIIGQTARHVSEEEALDYVFGYTCGNDVSARDCQLRRDMQWARGKSFDTFCPIGPWVETDLDPADVRVRSRLNGEEMQNQSTADLEFKVPRLIAALSRSFTLYPGTIIMTGTPSGVGMAKTPPVYLRPGDVFEVEIDGIGVLTNTVEAEADPAAE